jgi:hypothetical protein
MGEGPVTQVTVLAGGQHQAGDHIGIQCRNAAERISKGIGQAG